MKLSIVVNDQDIEADIHPGTLLLDFLRDREFCSEAVLLDGRLIDPAIALAAQAHLRQVTTADILRDPENLHPIQQAFVETGAVKSGDSSSLMILAALELLNENHEPTELEARDCIAGVQSTDDGKSAEAILLAATRMREAGLFGIPGYRTQEGAARFQAVSLR